MAKKYVKEKKQLVKGYLSYKVKMVEVKIAMKEDKKVLQSNFK